MSKLANLPRSTKRPAISASFFFAVSPRQRSFMQAKIAEGKHSTLGEVRDSLNLQPHIWDWFLEEYSKNNNLLREYNGVVPYHQVQNDKPLFRHEKVDKFLAATEFPPMVQVETSLGVSPDNDKLVDALEEEVSNLKTRIVYKDTEIKDLKDQLDNQEQHKLVQVQINDSITGESKKLEMVHKTMPDLLVRIECGLNVYLVGPAGSGKTKGAEQVSEALECEFGMMSVGPQTTKSDIFGYMNATGEYVTTEFRKRFEEGGVFLFDEIDAAHPGVLTGINAALAGDLCAFPDGMVKKHSEFRCIAAGNTFGTGPDRQYVGRNQMDAASIDRFDFLEWGYDNALELAIAKSITDNEEIATKWTAFVQSIRESIDKLNIRHVVSPRCTINGVKLLSKGVSEQNVQNTTLWKSLGDTDRKRVIENMAQKPPVSPTDKGKVFGMSAEAFTQVLKNASKIVEDSPIGAPKKVKAKKKKVWK